MRIVVASGADAPGSALHAAVTIASSDAPSSPQAYRAFSIRPPAVRDELSHSILAGESVRVLPYLRGMPEVRPATRGRGAAEPLLVRRAAAGPLRSAGRQARHVEGHGGGPTARPLALRGAATGQRSGFPRGARRGRNAACAPAPAGRGARPPQPPLEG